jgi:agmatine deiminase
VRRVLWLGDGIVGDDTDGHVDDLTRFVAPGVVVTVLEDDPSDENHLLLRDNLQRLQAMRDAAGNALRIVTLPMPEPMTYEDARLPASYANFYIGNAVVLTPVFGGRRDATALATLQSLFPDRRVVGINAVDLVWGLGAFHCLTQQQPAA